MPLLRILIMLGREDKVNFKKKKALDMLQYGWAREVDFSLLLGRYTYVLDSRSLPTIGAVR